ncbi:RHS repeat-associated core domain-containing protein [Listeria seeligeri]|uniref:RHS repeat-associated core domain-containing protein n=2 Tax=Listeria seeligeri TaxID=1640 RepID=UPI0016298943|nr:hypothetical protein [Listeria seeligeri]MBF2401322.1 hypothetical protein [Listeria seeligeri]MBF2415452.1 hypothetical protein [Listeria seeligeri]MBF2500872.1 hypothetical protein [Listeria seeligeri]MBF2522516.1 hypothetical protein [Listeria seeligeri]
MRGYENRTGTTDKEIRQAHCFVQYGYNAETHDYNGSQYLRARYYDTKTGSFGKQDSYKGKKDEPISQNRYAYAHNNPVLCLKRGTSKRIYLATNRHI